MTKMLISVSQDLASRLREQALKERRTISAVVGKAVENYIAEDQSLHE